MTLHYGIHDGGGSVDFQVPWMKGTEIVLDQVMAEKKGKRRPKSKDSLALNGQALT